MGRYADVDYCCSHSSYNWHHPCDCSCSYNPETGRKSCEEPEEEAAEAAEAARVAKLGAELRRVKLAFRGNTLEEARNKAVAFLSTSEGKRFSIISEIDTKQAFSIAEAKTLEQAIQLAERTPHSPMERCFRGITSVMPPEIIESGQSGVVEIHADTPEEVSKCWKSQAPVGARLDTYTCTIEPSLFRWLRRKKGVWKVHWFTAVKVRIPYMIEAKVTVGNTAPS